jgi:hypothetical protein
VALAASQPPAEQPAGRIQQPPLARQFGYRIPAHQRACERHSTWLGRAIQIDVTTAPDITAASRQASRLAGKHGITRLILAETAARQDTAGTPDASRRAAALALASPGLDPGHPDTAEAAAYPETIKTAAVLLRTPGALPAVPE